MKRVNIGDLKAHLSEYVQRVRKGEEVLVCDRNVPVARLTPCAFEDMDEQQQRLVVSGALAPPRRTRPRGRKAVWPTPPGNISDEVMEQLWREEREGR